MEAAFSQVKRVEPTALRAMFAEENRKQILNAARNAVSQKLPAIKNADLELARIHYEWSLSDLDGQTNEIFFVDLWSSAKNPPQQKSDRAATNQEDRIRVVLDREGQSLGVRIGR